MIRRFEFSNLVFSYCGLVYLVLVLNLNICKSVDEVNRQLLVSKLISYGIKDPLLGLLDCFISHRYHVARFSLRTHFFS